MDFGVIASKTVLLFISFIFWGASAGFFYVGANVLSSYKAYDPFLQDRYALLPAIIIIGVAVVMLVIGMVGCCATLRESKIGLGVFLGIILLIFSAEVAAFALGFIYKGKIKDDLHEPMLTAFQAYDGKTQDSHLVDYLQQEGCEEEVEKTLHNLLNYAMLIILAFAIVKFFGMLGICLLACKKENNGYQSLSSGTFA